MECEVQQQVQVIGTPLNCLKKNKVKYILLQKM